CNFKNISIPSYFYITGLSGMLHMRYYYICLFFVYFISLLGNSCLMFVIIMDRNLHTPKYISVFNLSLTDICETLIPKIIDMFLFDHQDISSEPCLTNMFFVYHFMNLQSLTLLALAYDRLVAICFPLRYHAIVTKPAMFLIIGVVRIVSVTFFSVLVGLVNRISFCRSNVLNSYFCDHALIYRLACNDNSINILIGKISFGLLICTPLILIIITYFCIFLALLKIAHGADRIKAIKTCTSHLILVTIGYLPLISNNIASITTPFHPNTRLLNNSLTQTIPPMLNPIIYTLKTEEVMQSIKELYKRPVFSIYKPT
uniref:G-protein coupled receptors family 1 profile domain-containing protein n=1 Tax=Sinocyclocheilus anshuiensis TaxID=1608454 RepID=A0A671S688_9TELE